MRNRINLLTIIFTLINIGMFSCCHSTKKKENINSQTSIITDITDKARFDDVFMEGTDGAYSVINKLILESNENICYELKNKTLVINIIVNDSLVKECNISVHEFNENGKMISYKKGYNEIENMLINRNAKIFDFIDDFSMPFYDFRIEVNKLCQKTKLKND